MIKVIILISVVAGILWGVFEAGHSSGYTLHKTEIADNKDDADKADQGKVKTVIKWRIKEKVKYRDKIKYIRTAEDPTGCADTLLSDMGFGL